MSSIHKGQRVAHRELDAESGGAKQGVVEETVGDNPELIIIKDDEHRQAFDSRELVPISGLLGPVILHPRHAWALLKTSRARLALLLEVALLALFLSATIFWGWGLRESILLGALIVVVALLAVALLEKDAAHRKSDLPL